ncbi:MAG: molybdopterin molybdotransferase MoeA [Planctomicrobium sp.]|jgi:molybdopterin molybdotransferase|nr:molybdopterin molybdotransferase MoeA [Planctomicrobium sp.]
MLNVSDALKQIIETVAPTKPSMLPLSDSLGCLLAEDVISDEDSPPFDKSMMDGYAVCASDLQLNESSSRDIELTIIGELTAGQQSELKVESGTTVRIMTGAPIPNGADAVIPVEQSKLLSEVKVSLHIERIIPQGTNILDCGKNVRQGEQVLSSGQRIRPQEIALLAELGRASIPVRQPPTVAILATGDELVEINETPGPGQIRNSNATMLAAQVAATGATPIVLPIAKDQREDLRAKIEGGLQCDFLCLSGGVSMGKLDLVPSELAAAGVQQIFHKVAMKPGKPIWFGKRSSSESQSSCYVFGLPGNPISSMICFELFVKTALRKFQGEENPFPPLIEATLQKDFSQRGDREVWFPSYAEIENGKVVVTPTGWKGSSDIRSTAQANCSASFPAGERIFTAGESVQVLVWSGSRLNPKL